MFTFQAIAQQGMNFSGLLFKNKKSIGGIGKSDKGVYVKLKEKLNVSEMQELLVFVGGLHPSFANSKFELIFINE